MANEEQVALLKQGAKVWNPWRKENPDAEIDLRGANLRGADLKGVNLMTADLRGVNLRGADLHWAKLIAAKLIAADLRGANLREADINTADLSRADLSRADLSVADLSVADLTRADLRDADLNGADLRSAYLTATDLSRADLGSANLNLARLREANLRDAKLSEAQVLYTDFREATLTGACIADWQIGSSTNLKHVKCDYIFRAFDNVYKQFAGRLPVASESIFVPGEFEKWIQVRKGVLDTIDITFNGGIDWQLFFKSLQQVRQRHPEANVRTQSVQEIDGTYVAALRLETEIDGEALKQLRAEVEVETKTFYERQLIRVRAENRVLERSLDNAMEKLAMASSNNYFQTFNGPVGNAAGNNYGTMTSTINQNQEAISQLITALRASAQSFPSEQKEDVLMELDDLETDLNEPTKQAPKRIGRRLRRLIASGTAAMTIAGGAATFSGDVNEFTQNVLELGEKVGISRDDVQGNQPNP
jgi:uncharacterized protein YjbI with pentapeptide repeats